MALYDNLTREGLIALVESLRQQRQGSGDDAVRSDPLTVSIDLEALPPSGGPILKWLADSATMQCLAASAAARALFGQPHDSTEQFPLQLVAGVGPMPPGVTALPERCGVGVATFVRADGTVAILQVCQLDVHCLGRAATLVLVQDVTVHDRTAGALRRIEEWMQQSQTYAKFGILEWDVDGRVTGASEHTGVLFALPAEPLALTRQQMLAWVHPDDRQRVGEMTQTLLSGGDGQGAAGDGFDIEYRIVLPGGEVRWIHERGGVQRYVHGGTQHLLAVVQDVTGQRLSELALRESEERFRLFAENIREVIWVSDPAFERLFYVSQASIELLGMQAAELYKGIPHWQNLVHPDDRAQAQAALEQQRLGQEVELEVRLLRPDGKQRWLRFRSFPVKNGRGERIANGIVEDVTDRKQLEQERIANMVLQRKTLVREVHHRIKNHLQGVAGLLRQHAIHRPEVGDIIDLAIAQVRTVAVVHGLQGQAADNDIVLCEMVPAIARSIEAVLPAHARIEVKVDVPQRIRVNEQESVPIALILNELILNAAKHADSEGQASIAIAVGWDAQLRQAHIAIVNPGSLLPGFDFASAAHTGTGLDLVRSLMPTEGGSLSFRARDGTVEVSLALSAPNIYNL